MFYTSLLSVGWCLENSMDSTVHGVTKSGTQLRDFQFQRKLAEIVAQLLNLYLFS